MRNSDLSYIFISLLVLLITSGVLLTFIGVGYGFSNFFIIGTILLIFGLGSYFLYISFIRAPIGIEKNQELAEKFYQKGLSYLHKENLFLAINFINKALGHNPKHIRALADKGLILSKLGKYNQALKLLNQALELKPDFEDAKIYRDSVIEKLDQLQDD